MPLLNPQTATGIEPITDISAPTTVTLSAGTPSTVLAVGDRKGHLIRNTGANRITISYGLSASKKAYDVILSPGASYLFDRAELIPYSATSLNGSSLEVIEFF